MVRSGIALFIAAGNSATSGSIGTPGSAEDVITVGALDKDSGIAVYSSQGPSEEGRIKPNIAYVGSNVMSVEANSGTGYTDMSGTSMATPGAAGVAALMYQANPDLSPFDVRNIMQETATYRRCEYMLKNEPCLEDLAPKNRQNNVYGHGEVRALDSVMEAAQQDYDFNNNITINLITQIGMDNRIHLESSDKIQFNISQTVDTIQWRSNHLRDDWTNLHSFDHGDEEFTISAIDLIHNLEHLPGITLEGNHTISIRGIGNGEGDSYSTAIITADLMLMNPSKELSSSSGNGDGVSSIAIAIGAFAIVFLAVLLIAGLVTDKEEGSLASVDVSAKQYTESIDGDIDSIADAELDD